jgi:TonB family protein
MIIALVAFLFAAAPQVPAGTNLPGVSADVATPDDARGRLELAEKVNGLGKLKIPWHLKAHYEIFAADGSISERGNYEEWRVSDKRYRLALHGPSISVEEYGSDQGVFRTAGQDWPLEPLSSITGVIARPIWPPISEDAAYENGERKLGAKEFPCTVVEQGGTRKSLAYATTFCFSRTNAVLLYASTPGSAKQIVFSHIRALHGAYLAFEIEQFVDGRSWMKLHVDVLENLAPAQFTALTKPADALQVLPRVRPGERECDPSMSNANRLLTNPSPIYPEHARSRGVKGTVVLDGLIDRDGHVSSLRVIAGPQLLQQPSLDAVRNWTFKPYELNGQPVEEETEINLNYPAGAP